MEAKSTKEKLREKRKKLAAHRLKLGFKDKDAEEGVDDQVLEDLYQKEKDYQRFIEESKERNEIKTVVDINAFSKEEIEREMLRDEEKFKKR